MFDNEDKFIFWNLTALNLIFQMPQKNRVKLNLTLLLIKLNLNINSIFPLIMILIHYKIPKNNNCITQTTSCSEIEMNVS